MAGGGAFDLAGRDAYFASLAGGGTVTNNGTTDATLTLGSDGADSVFSGSLSDGLLAALALTKVGTNRLTLSGPLSYTGLTMVNSGTLDLENTIPGVVNVAAGESDRSRRAAVVEREL